MPSPSTQYELPTAEDVAFYQEHGWFISKTVLTEEAIAAAIEASDRFYAGHRDGDVPGGTSDTYDWRPEHGLSVVRLNDYITFQSRALKDFILSPAIGEIASRLCQSGEVRLFHSSLSYKPPRLLGNAGSIGWHTDKAYLRNCTSDEILTAFIPLHDCDTQMGTLLVVDGSHRWDDSDPRVLGMKAAESIRWDFRSLTRQLMSLDREIKIVPMKLRRGEISFHNCRLLHGSLPNMSDEPRRVAIVHMQDGDNRFRKVLGSDGMEVHNEMDRICRTDHEGNPDYTDPNIFPRIWPQEGLS